MSPFHTSPLSFLHPCPQHREGCFQVKVTFLVYTRFLLPTCRATN